MLKMMPLLHLLLCYNLIGIAAAAGQESYEVVHVHGSTPVAMTGQVPLAVFVSDDDLPKVSSSILQAESWLRTHVLGHFPAAKITTIAVGDSALCKEGQEEKLGLVLPSLKNIFHSLTRWGLEKDIKVSPAFTPECLTPNFLGQDVVKSLLEFFQEINSTHFLISLPDFPHSSDATKHMVSSHLDSLRMLGFYMPHKINVIASVTKDTKIRHLGRKLSSFSFIGSIFTDPLTGKPKPIPELPKSPNQPPIFGYPAPPNALQNPVPLPPLTAASSPSMSFSLPPQQPPYFVVPSTSPHGGNALPPCNPSTAAMAPAPTPERMGMEKGLWCVAKPNVPMETLQVAMDYACGEGGADCEAIRPRGNCYSPNTVVAHASYAFNSYWQKNKKKGGTCAFGGTAMIINSDPSFLHCKFLLD